MNKNVQAFFLPVTVIIVAVVISTVLEGQATERWPFVVARTEKLETFSERLDDVPMVVGEWQGEAVPVDEKEFKASKCDKGISRKYRHLGTGDVVHVYLVSGVGRHITIHTPDQCYRGAGFVMEGDMLPFTVKKVSDVEFLTAGFRKEDAKGSQRLRIFWGYSDNGKWRGPRLPKPEFGSRPALYKMYLIQDADSLGNSLDDATAVSFAEEFMPVINKVLFEERPSLPAELSINVPPSNSIVVSPQSPLNATSSSEPATKPAQ